MIGSRKTPRTVRRKRRKGSQLRFSNWKDIAVGVGKGSGEIHFSLLHRVASWGVYFNSSGKAFFTPKDMETFRQTDYLNGVMDSTKSRSILLDYGLLLARPLTRSPRHFSRKRCHAL